MEVTIDQLKELFSTTEKSKKDDADNKYKNAFTKVDYLERARREALEPVLVADWAQPESQIAGIMDKIKASFTEQQSKKQRLLPARELIVRPYF